MLDEKDKELTLRESDLRELIAKHERDIETIMQKENIDLQDHVIKMLESKMKDTNEVLDGKVTNNIVLFFSLPFVCSRRNSFMRSIFPTFGTKMKADRSVTSIDLNMETKHSSVYI